MVSMMDTSDGSPNDRRDSHPVYRKIGTYLPTLIILGLAIPILVFLYMMQLNGWKIPTFGLRSVIGQAGPVSEQVYLYASPSSKSYFTKIGGNYETLLAPWRNYLLERKVSFEEIKESEALNNLGDGVLIVPSALALSDLERNAILGFRAKGGGVLATWATGSRTSAGEWSGWQFLESLGAKMRGELPANSESRQLVLAGESPLSMHQPAGMRIWMGKTTESLLRLTGESMTGRFMNWARVPEDDRREEGAIIYSEDSPRAGRSAVFAFAETSWESRPFVPHQLIDDTLSWLRREPVIVKAAWPSAKLAAQIIEMDTEQGFENAAAFADMMKSIQYHATFYVLTSVGIQFPDLLQRLSREFELGYHGDVHVSFKDQSVYTQEQRILNMKAELASILGNTPQISGFRAPTEGYDSATELLIHKNGMRHHAADPNRTESRLPLLVKMAQVPIEDSLVVLPRTQRDDINIYWEKLNVEQTTKALIDDFNIAIDTGSLGFLSIHSQNFGEGSVLRQAMPPFLTHLQKKRNQILLASSGEIAQWWRDRERLTISSTVHGKRLDFNLTVKGSQPVNGASLIIALPQKGIMPTVQSTKIGALTPSIIKLDDYRAAVVFDKLNPGDYVYQATFGG
ncbi:MAG: polysaccharide deacetylase family protein [Methylotenera sp.]|nr:polysaccharide deacetylase family protein [Methylotenera sp.]